MYTIKIDDESNENYYDIIMDTVKLFDCYEYIESKIEIILKTIQNDIKYFIYNDSDSSNIELIIKLDDYNYYGFNYDFKNYPLISFGCSTITLHYNDGIINFDDDLLINISELDFKNFEKIV